MLTAPKFCRPLVLVTLVFVVSMFVVSMSASEAESGSDEWTLRTDTWAGRLTSGTKVEIRNLHGDLRVRKFGGEGGSSSHEKGSVQEVGVKHADAPKGASEDNIHLVAAVQRHRDDPRPVEIVAEEADGILMLEVHYLDPTGADGSAGAVVSEAWARRRVDVTAYVPQATETSVEGKDGLVEIRGIQGAVTARTRGGAIDIRGLGPVNASSRNGKITVRYRSPQWQGVTRLETLTGEIEVEIPRNGRAKVELETRGSITTDYSVEIRRQGDSHLKRAKAKIGKKGGDLILKSNRGPIKLVEGFVAVDEK